MNPISLWRSRLEPRLFNKQIFTQDPVDIRSAFDKMISVLGSEPSHSTLEVAPDIAGYGACIWILIMEWPL
jgi:hypothetical protein